MHSTIAKAICVSKNEYDNIEAFIQYYSYLFGYNNVHIIDNGSTDETVLAIYEKYMPLGVTVTVDTTSFNDAEQFMSNHISKYKGTCEWMFVLETDEFVFWTPNMTDYNATVPKDKIIQYLQSIPDDVSVLLYEKVLSSVVTKTDQGYTNNKFACPPKNITKFVDQKWQKFIVRIDCFDRMIQWSHICQVNSGNNQLTTELGLLHFHQTGSRRTFERSKQIVIACNNFNINIPLFLQIPVCKRIVECNCKSHHRHSMYLETITRQFICENFNIIIGRLPSQVELQELLQINNIEHVLLHILRNAEAYRQNPHNVSLDDLIFMENWVEKWDYYIRQLQNTFKKMIKHP